MTEPRRPGRPPEDRCWAPRRLCETAQAELLADLEAEKATVRGLHARVDDLQTAVDKLRERQADHDVYRLLTLLGPFSGRCGIRGTPEVDDAPDVPAQRRPPAAEQRPRPAGRPR